MTSRPAVQHVCAEILLLALVGTAACTDTVFRDRDQFNPPVDQNSGFLGYFTASEKQTSCGNCHVAHQADWEETHHANAWQSLVESGHQQASCNACHSVSSLGNAATAPAGYEAVADESYQDVQCESCHGPGFQHAQTPDATAPPLASLAAAPGAKTSCSACHTGDFAPFVEEWAASAHGLDGHGNEDAVAGGTASCRSCHEGRNVLKAWGITANYVERDQTVTVDNRLTQTCAVCHDPHSGANPHQLRFPIDVADVNQNLCMKCHQRRAEPDPASSRGPHAPQGPMVLGDAGWQPPGFDISFVQSSSHGVSGNPRLCAGCHVNNYTVTDASGNVTFQSTGHLFLPIPCLDAQGRPQADNTCAYNSTARTWAACTNSGCHASADIAVGLFATVRSRLTNLTNQIWEDINGNDAIDPAPTDGGFLSNTTEIPTSGTSNQYVTNDGVITTAEGARFNVRMLRVGGSDGSSGVHQPFYAEALLLATIDQLQVSYPGLAPPSPDMRRYIQERKGAVMTRPFTPVVASR